MPTNQLAPPDLPGLFMRSIGVPNGLGPPDLQRPSMQNTPPLAAPPPTDGTMTPADVWSFNRDNLGDAWQAAQDPATWREAAQNYGQGMLMGSIGPEGKGFTAAYRTPDPHAFDRIRSEQDRHRRRARRLTGTGCITMADNEGVAHPVVSGSELARSAACATGTLRDDYGLPQATVDQIVQGNMRQGANMGGDRTFIQQALDGLGNRNDPASRVARDTYTNLLGQQGGHMYEVNVNADPAGDSSTGTSR